MSKPAALKPKDQNWFENHFDFCLYSILAYSAVLYSILNAQYSTGVYNDDAVYIIGARALCKRLPFHSLILKPDYPLPGLPLLLAPFVRLIHNDWTSLEWLSVFLTVVLIYLVGRWARRWLSGPQAVAVLSLLAFNPLLCLLSGVVMPTPYYLAAVASFLLLDGLLERFSAGKALALGFIVGWGSLVRPEGFVLAVAISVILVMTPRGRRILRLAVIPVIGWAFFLFYWCRIRQQPVSEYGGDLKALLYFWTHHFASGMRFAIDLFEIFFIRALTAFTLRQMRLVPLLVPLSGIFAFLGLAGMGFRALWRQNEARRSELVGMALFCGLYFAIHLFWHVAVPRYALPVLPFVLIFIVRGFQEAVRPLARRALWTGAGLGLLLTLQLAKNYQDITESIYSPDPMKGPPWKSLEWIERHTPAGARTLSFIAPSVELFADRPALTGIKAYNVDMYLYLLRHYGLDYIVDRNVVSLTPGVEGTEDINRIWRRMRLWIAHYPERFRLVFSDPAEQTAIYQIVTEPDYGPAYEKYQVAAQDYLNGDEGRAFTLLGDLLARHPGMGTAVNLQGSLYLRRGDFKNAERDFLKAITLMPDSPIAMVNLASVYRLEGQAARSNDYIQRALYVSGVNGDRELLQIRLNALYRLWDHHQAIMFMDPL